jgi:hypothetical protein
MQRHVLRCGLEKIRNLRLRQPDRLALEPALDARAAILPLVKNQ